MIENSKSAADEAKPTEKSESAISSDVSSVNITSHPKIMPNLPLEIIDNIFFFCTRGTLFNCLTLSQDYVGLAIMQLYRSVPTTYHRRVTMNGKLVTNTRTPSVFHAPLNPSLKQALRFAHYRYAVRDIEDTDNMLCGGPYDLPDFAKIVAEYPRIRSLKWKQTDHYCDYSLERSDESVWANLRLNVVHPGAMWGRGEGYLKSLTREIGMGVSSLKLLDMGDVDQEYYDDLEDIYEDMTTDEMNLAFVNMIRPHISQLRSLHFKRGPYVEYRHSITPMANILPPTVVDLNLERITPKEIERIFKCSLPNLAKFTFSLDFPVDWAYTSKSGASENVEASPSLRKANMLVAGCGDWDYEPVPPSAMDAASWLADILPFNCDLTVKDNPEAMCYGNCPHQLWLNRWMVDVEKIYRFHRTTMGKERLNEVRKE